MHVNNIWPNLSMNPLLLTEQNLRLDTFNYFKKDEMSIFRETRKISIIFGKLWIKNCPIVLQDWYV